MPELTRSRFASADKDVTEQLFRDRFGTVEFSRGSLAYEETTFTDDALRISDQRAHGDFDCGVEVPVFIAMFGSRSFHWELGSVRGTLDEPVMMRPGDSTSNSGSGASNLTVLDFQPGVLESVARVLYADDDLRVAFDSGRPVSATTGAEWISILRFTVAAEAVLDNDLLRATVFRSLAVSTLESFRLSGDRRQRVQTFEALQSAYRAAVAFFDDFASLPITVDDAARAAGVSQETLRLAFRAHSPLGFDPGRYLERSRLAAAHLDLVNADPTRGDTVTAIARRWGFGHLGRFARIYRGVYGVTPKWVLDR